MNNVAASKWGNRSLSAAAALQARRIWIALALGLWAAGGCGPPAGKSAPPPTPPHAAQAGPTEIEFWEVHQIGGKRVGYGRTAIRPLTENHPGAPGEPLVRIEALSHMTFQRAGQEVKVEVQIASTETAGGRLLDMSVTMAQGSMLIQQTRGQVRGDHLELTTTTQGKTVTTAIPWAADVGGLLAGEQSLWRSPMQPGQRRTIRAMVPGINQVGTSEMAAGSYEAVEILGRTYRLLRIDVTTTFADGQSYHSTLWVDRHGDILRKREEAMNLESFRVPKEVALAESDQAPFDLVLGMSVPLDRRLPHPHQTKRLRYLLTLDGGDPATVFPSGDSQRVEALGSHTAVVTVYAVRPDQPGNPQAPRDPPSDEDRQANNLIQSDDPTIVTLAKRAAGSQRDPWQMAVALERFARQYITSTDYSQAFATAAQVAQTRTGDCTEHAVLLAALARASGIPARVAVGLVYTEQTGGPALGYHMWNELYLNGRWVPMDATLGQGGIGAAHLKLSHSSLAAASAFSSFLPVAQVAGRLKVKIEDVE